MSETEWAGTRSGRRGKEESRFPMPLIELRSVGRPARSPVAIPTLPSSLIHEQINK